MINNDKQDAVGLCVWIEDNNAAALTASAECVEWTEWVYSWRPTGALLGLVCMLSKESKIDL